MYLNAFLGSVKDLTQMSLKASNVPWNLDWAPISVNPLDYLNFLPWWSSDNTNANLEKLAKIESLENR